MSEFTTQSDRKLNRYSSFTFQKIDYFHLLFLYKSDFRISASERMKGMSERNTFLARKTKISGGLFTLNYNDNLIDK